MKIFNRHVAEALDMTPSAISMIRRNRRFPMIPTMEAIQRVYGWTVDEQFAARDDYAAAFNAKLQEHYAKVGVPQ